MEVAGQVHVHVFFYKESLELLFIKEVYITFFSVFMIFALYFLKHFHKWCSTVSLNRNYCSCHSFLAWRRRGNDRGSFAEGMFA